MLYRTIVLDDDKATRDLLTSLLKSRNHEVFSFSAPGACPFFAAPEKGCPPDCGCGDFLITDNRMPGMTGLEFIQRQVDGKCRSAMTNKAIMSGHWSPEEWERGTRLGCKMFRKPLDLDELLNWLKEREGRIPRHRKLIPVG